MKKVQILSDLDLLMCLEDTIDAAEFAAILIVQYPFLHYIASFGKTQPSLWKNCIIRFSDESTPSAPAHRQRLVLTA